MKASFRGFTLIELMIVIAIIGLMATILMYGQRNAQEKRRDVKRVTDIEALQKGLAIYISRVGNYPVMTGCIDGNDAVTLGLRAQGVLQANDRLVDPLNPSNITSCYYYISSGAAFTLRYTLEQTSTAGAAGNHTVQP